MRYINIRRLEPGMVLVSPIRDKNGSTLVQANSPLSKFVVERLQMLPETGVYIYDELSSDILMEGNISMKVRQQLERKIGTMSIDDSIMAAHLIVSDLQNTSMIRTDMSALNDYDNNTFNHSLNVAVYASTLAIRLGWNTKEVELVALSGLLHDIGKSKIPLELLNKEEQLSPSEIEMMHQHATFGYEMLKDSTIIPAVVKMGVYGHHENFDGTGYPRQLKGETIYKYARILRICDVWDALLSKRSYKARLSPTKALDIMKNEMTGCFDPVFLNAFQSSILPFPKGVPVILTTDQQAIVAEDNEKDPLNPIIRFFNGDELNLAYSDINIVDFDW